MTSRTTTALAEAQAAVDAAMVALTHACNHGTLTGNHELANATRALVHAATAERDRLAEQAAREAGVAVDRDEQLERARELGILRGEVL